MTQAECYFCKGPATAVKQETEYVEAEQADGTWVGHFEIELLPICDPCDEEVYDGTEQYPALLPLTALDTE